MEIGIKRFTKRLFFFMLMITYLSSIRVEAASRWTLLRKKYLKNNNVDCLIFVQYKGGSKCRVKMFKKTDAGKWNKILSCKGYVGQNGIGKKREGDRKTPRGTYRITGAFGILDDPGTQIPYIKLNQYLYWSGEAKTYNKMVDARKLGHRPAGEHLISYSPYYNYALVIGYNRKRVVGIGAAIFMHCTGSKSYTAGCVAIKEKKMKKVMQNVTKKTRICIY